MEVNLVCGNLMIYKPPQTSDRLIFEHDESLCADLLPIYLEILYKNGKLEHFLQQCLRSTSTHTRANRKAQSLASLAKKEKAFSLFPKFLSYRSISPKPYYIESVDSE
ncbi:cytochrome c biogenesis FC [Striga asiatica]|uniref:Cytochrome c biogenesis FC n=1 Tax=Striga asiatica TaxID=4170 RepID=A0A5A7PKJ6_STRAF|nr:cytochrome c biogenesis FC [Striga asiatica]